MNIVNLDNNALDRIALRQSRKHKFVLFGELGSEAVKPWLVRNLLGDGEQSAFYGKPGSGKSVLVGDLGLHVAAGREWHGRQVLQGAVLYVALERRKLVERRAIAFAKRHDLQELPFAILAGLYDFRDRRTAAEIIGAIQEIEGETKQKVVLIIVDTVSKALSGGDENSPKDMGALVAVVAAIQQQTKAHVLLVHHIPADGSERLRGHGLLLGAMDTTLHVEKLASDSRRATVIKANDSEEGAQVTFKLESVTIGQDESGEFTTAPVVVPIDEGTPLPAGPNINKNQQTMFAILHAAGMDGLTTDEWNEKARAAGLGVRRRADLIDFRMALEAKQMVKSYNGRWTVRHQ